MKLEDSWIRQKPETGDEPPVLESIPLRHTHHVASSTAQNDSGVFEFNFRDERYMPFEGAGAISNWKLTLPKNFTVFDYQTISDVIMRISYTAEEDGVWRDKIEKLNGDARESIRKYLSDPGLPRLFSLRQEFPDVWHQLLNSPVGTTINLEITDRHLPYLFSRLKQLEVGLQTSDVDIFLRAEPKPTFNFAIDGKMPSQWDEEYDGLYKGIVSSIEIVGKHTLKITSSGTPSTGATITMDHSKLADILLRVHLKTSQ